MAVLERRRMRFTQKTVKFMLDANLIGPHDYELIHGDLIEKMPQNQPHVIAVRKSTRALESVFGFEHTGTASPIFIDEDSAPEPDVFITRSPLAQYTENPNAQECLLAVEVSDSTLSEDKTTKKILYAQAGIQEYWIVNLNARTLIVHRDPVGDDYQQIQTLAEADSVTPIASTQAISVASLLS